MDPITRSATKPRVLAAVRELSEKCWPAVALLRAVSRETGILEADVAEIVRDLEDAGTVTTGRTINDTYIKIASHESDPV